jgi:hypothetical protein
MAKGKKIDFDWGNALMTTGIVVVGTIIGSSIYTNFPRWKEAVKSKMSPKPAGEPKTE